MKKRILSCLLSIAMCLTLLPLGIQAQAAYFGDVTSHWARSYIEDAVDMGLFNGTAPNRFEPESAMTRAMFVTVLYRMDGGEAERSANFIDVPRGSWYSDAVAWASENSIVTGTSAIRFSPNDSVTREQMVTILNRYLTASGAALGSDGEAPAISFRDSSSIAPYAREAVEKMQRASIVSGKPSGFGYRFDPQGCATRAEVACIMCKFLDQLSYDDIDNEEPDPEAAYEQMDKITQSSTLKSLSSQYENASDSQKKNLAEQAISYFEQQEENGTIDYCDVDRDSGVIQYWVDGLEAYYLLYDLDKVANGDASSVSSALTASASTYATDVVGAVSRTTTVTSGKALVLESYASSASSDIAKDFHYRSSYFKQCAENSGLTTTIQTGITVANLQRGLASYDVLYFNMHGALYNDEPFICLEEKATLEKYVKPYSTDVKDGNVCLYG
ncbi:MAG: S-layer homology domain-containing protein, partial [Agathobaculum butyriciproducens]|nr:S-layer homology domain-containing protein [Agathobaculum butyriciproducens]